MKNTQRIFVGGLKTLAMVGLFTLVLGSLLIPVRQVSADTLTTTCTTATQQGLTGTVVTDSTSCSIPSGVTISRATLDYTLDDGGEISVNSQQVFTVAPEPGTDTGSIDLSTSLFTPGSSFLVKVTARNAMDANGPSGQVFGQAIVKIFASSAQTPVNGGWSDWSTQSTQCGYSGTQTRTCTNPSPSDGGAYCSGLSTQSYTNQSCTSVINGGWSGWSSRDYSCGTSGTQTRTCTNPSPSGGGAYCSGSSTQSYTNSSCSGGGSNYYPPANVSISADRTNILYNESTIIRWYPSNADTCRGSDGSNGWSGTKSAFSDVFYTGSLSRTTTYTISCSNSTDSSGSRSVTVYVGNQTPIVNPVYSALTAITNPATLVTTNSAQLNSLILNSSNNYLNNSANAWFEWGPTANLGNRTPSTSIGSFASTRHVSFLTGLSSGTTYYFRAVAENSSWRSVGTTLNFTTTRTGGIFIAPTVKAAGTSLVLISSSVDRNQPIVPTIDNSRPHPGDEINYTVNYQNVGTGSITGLVLQMNLPFEVDYLSSNPSNPTISGNTLTFNLGSLKANGQGVVTARVRVRDNIPAGTNLNFPATLRYVDPSGVSQSVSANVTAQVWGESSNSFLNLGANVFGANFFPDNIFGWLLLILLILALVMLVKYLFSQPFSKKTTTVTDQPLSKKTTTTTIQ